jgi:hypothetical protein
VRVHSTGPGCHVEWFCYDSCAFICVLLVRLPNWEINDAAVSPPLLSEIKIYVMDSIRAFGAFGAALGRLELDGATSSRHVQEVRVLAHCISRLAPNGCAVKKQKMMGCRQSKPHTHDGGAMSLVTGQ